MATLSRLVALYAVLYPRNANRANRTTPATYVFNKLRIINTPA